MNKMQMHREHMQKMGYALFFQKWQNIKEHLSGTQRKGCNEKKSGMLYWFRCTRLDYDKEYTGESAITFW